MNNVVLVTGANGFIGQVLCREIQRRGWKLKVAMRHPGEYANDAMPVVIGDIDGETDWSDALKGVEVVVHLAARVHVMQEASGSPQKEFDKVNLHGTDSLARQAVRAGVKRLVYVSSIGVNGLATSMTRPFTEADVPNPHSAYALSKWKAEQTLLDIACKSSLEIVIVRPPLVYGPGVPGNFAQMLEVLAKGMPLPLASINNLRSLIYVDNLVDALITCATHPAAAGKTYLVSEGEDISTSELLRRLTVLLDVRSRLFPFPPVLLKFFGRITGKRKQINQLLGSLMVDSGKIRQELNWTAPYTLQQGLQATAEWYKTFHP